MNLTDRCWTLDGGGIRERTVSEATRGDCTITEFYTTEREAHLAAAAYCDRMEAADRYGADQWHQRAAEARAAAERVKP